MNTSQWKKFQEYSWSGLEGRFFFDYSFIDDVIGLDADIQDFALAEMERLERGERVNIDEDRMVGHYWLRAPELAPTAPITDAIQKELSRVRSFAESIRNGASCAPSGKPFASLLLIGIGGSALGPQLISDVFQRGERSLHFFSIDNTDPDGIALTLSQIPSLAETLVLVVSKSGGTKETRNGMVLVEQAFQLQGLHFARHAVAITGDGSLLDCYAREGGWIERFPMWDWVGGRTSLWSTVGLLPAALLGINIDLFLQGAREMDACTRVGEFAKNPALTLARIWQIMAPSRDMVVLPYRDRLLLFSRYLQQLIMESLGKEYDTAGNPVHEGIAVYGNKGSTDQHAYVQQLRDGRDNVFACFIEVLEERVSFEGNDADYQTICEMEVEDGATAGDYLQGFLLGTQSALYEKGRPSVMLSLSTLNEYTLGALLALFERAVSFYASFTKINAYHQPGVEAGKKAAERIVQLKKEILSLLKQDSTKARTVEEIALELSSEEQIEIFKILERLAANEKVRKNVVSEDRFACQYQLAQNG
jgi:glucose-6-phosphate isomerase